MEEVRELEVLRDVAVGEKREILTIFSSLSDASVRD
jgi:hypothetical protein